MKQYQGQYRVTKMANVLEVSRGGYYAWLKSTASQHEQEDKKLLALIVTIFEEHKGRYGSPRIWRELKDTHNPTVSRKRVKTTDSRHGYRI